MSLNTPLHLSIEPPTKPGNLVRCLIGSFILRAAAAGAAELIAFYIADIEQVHRELRGSIVIGLATMMFFAAEVSGALIFGALTDKHGPRRYLVLGSVFGAIAAVAMAMLAVFPAITFMIAVAIPSIVLARCFQGLSTASGIPAVLAFLSGYAGDEDAKRGKVMSIFEVTAIAGMAMGFVVIGMIWDQIHLWAFFPVIALYLISAVLFWPVGRGMVARGVSGGHGISLHFMRSPRARRLVPAWIGVNAVLGIWLTHSALQLKREDDPIQLLVGGFSGTQISIYGSMALLLFVGGIGAWGFLMARLGSLKLMAISLCGMVALCPALYFLNHSEVGNRTEIGLFLALSAAALFVTSGFTPAALAYLSRIAEEHAEERGKIMGLYSVLLGVGQAIGAVSGGIGASWAGIDGMIVLSMFFTVCSALAVVALMRVDQAPDPSLIVPVQSGTTARGYTSH